jgi:3D (Asp-Asp-Asp) domain-containing protein
MKRFITIILAFLTAVPALFALPARGLQSARVTQPPISVGRAATVQPAAVATSKPASIAQRDQSLLARVTVYWAKGGQGSDQYTRRHQSAIGQRLHTGHCAVDPRKIPYGSRVVLPTGETLAAVDTGAAVKNRKAARRSGRTTSERSALVVDRFFETKRQALAWANSHPLFMPVRVVRPGAQVAVPQQLPILNAQRVTGAPTSQVTQQTTVTSNQSVASGTTVARNPLNRIGR